MANNTFSNAWKGFISGVLTGIAIKTDIVIGGGKITLSIIDVACEAVFSGSSLGCFQLIGFISLVGTLSGLYSFVVSMGKSQNWKHDLMTYVIGFAVGALAVVWLI